MLAVIGKMVDVSDGTFIEFELPEEYRLTVSTESEDVPTARRNAKESWWVVTQEKVQMDLTFVRQVSTYLDVERPCKWLRARCYPSFVGGAVFKPPPSFVLIMPGVDSAASWEIKGDLEFEGRGNVGIDGLVGSFPPVMVVRFTLVRSDGSMNRLMEFL